jgi:hypothetical protein
MLGRMLRLRTSFLFTLLVAIFVSLSLPAFADDWVYTGSAVRSKSVGPFNAKVYSIRHDMKGKPSEKSRAAVINADVDKKFTWQMLRDVDAEKIQKAIREGFAMNGFSDGARIGQFVAAFKEEVKENSTVVISYTAANKTTTIWVQTGGGRASIAGDDFMKAVWSLWFGKNDQPAMGDQLMSKL